MLSIFCNRKSFKSLSPDLQWQQSVSKGCMICTQIICDKTVSKLSFQELWIPVSERKCVARRLWRLSSLLVRKFAKILKATGKRRRCFVSTLQHVKEIEFTFTLRNVKKEIKRALGTWMAKIHNPFAAMVPYFAVCGTTMPCAIRPWF